MPFTDQDTPYDVLVVGAGPAGLTTALSAAQHGARVLVVERRPGPSDHPRAIGISTRTMEVFRSLGVADAVHARSIDVAPGAGSAATLADPGLVATPTGFPSPEEALAVSPEHPVICPQDRIEPLLVEHVRRAGGEVRFATALTALHQDGDGVRAVLAGNVVRARYAVGADGRTGVVRSATGIPVEHLGDLGAFAQVLFRADLSPAVGARPHALYNLSHPRAGGLVLTFGGNRWGYARPWRSGSPAGQDHDGWTALLRLATGLPDLRPEILDVTVFGLAAELATTMRAGRVFLAGDAAHRTTPVGAVGLNTAVHDGHNLGWKLAWCARGVAGDALLESYAAERWPVGARNTHRSLRMGETDPSDGLPGDLGTVYRSDVVAAAEAGPEFADPREAAARPGERAPHAWVSVGGRRRSVLDLAGGRLALLTPRQDGGWRRAAAALAASGAPIAAPVVSDPDGRLARALHLDGPGAVLVRPDGYVAWRADGAAADPVGALRGALALALGRRVRVAATA